VRSADLLDVVTINEKRFLLEREAQSGIRLACQATFISRGEVEIYIPQTSRRAEQILQTEGLKADDELEGLVPKYFVYVKKPALGNVKAVDSDL
jgi:uncharacterized 2Fe-2S/4Fe-4S cluster protein (DUF4445 family)